MHRESDVKVARHVGSMNPIRIAISLFILVLIGVSATGFIWTGSHQSPSQSAASRIVLTLGALAGVVGLAVLWRTKPPKRR
jgi:hypothetical protein